jgi:hypothetical protein
MGGLRATFLCDYSHTLILMVIILYFMFQVYAQDSLIGSPSKMYELLKEAAIKMPVAGNQDGSYLTMKSNNALIFGVIQLCSGSGTVFLDQGKYTCIHLHFQATAHTFSSILATCDRFSSINSSPSVPTWRYRLVRNSIWLRHHTWAGCCGTD